MIHNYNWYLTIIICFNDLEKNLEENKSLKHKEDRFKHARYRPYNILSKQKVKIPPSSSVVGQTTSSNVHESKSCIQQVQEYLPSSYQEQKAYSSKLKQKSYIQQDLTDPSENNFSNNQLSDCNSISD